MSAPRQRADRLLVERGLFESRAKAQAAIEAGSVIADDGSVRKASEETSADAIVCVRASAAHPYVSRGGVKLAAALDHFGFDPKGRVCLDVGASTGGFTQVLLERGARRVYAVDVGRGQLHETIRCAPEVISLEETDIRNLSLPDSGETPDFVTVDVSFISLKLVLPAALGSRQSTRPTGCTDQAAIRGRPARRKERHRPRSRPFMPRSATTLRNLSPRSAGVCSASSPRRSPAAMAMPNSCSELCVIEQLTIARLGHRGDGIADTPNGAGLCALYCCRARRVTVEPVAGHPDRRHLVHVDKPSHRTGPADLQAFRHLRRLRIAALVIRRIAPLEALAGY